MKLSKATTFLGRNGTFKCTGFNFQKTARDTTCISPVTGKEEQGRCRIEVPNEDLPEFCNRLQNGLVSLVLKNVPPGYLPGLLGLNPQLDALISKKLGE